MVAPEDAPVEWGCMDTPCSETSSRWLPPEHQLVDWTCTIFACTSTVKHVANDANIIETAPNSKAWL